MFRKILIANRGEIACRVIQTAHRLGIRCVAVYSDADANARHVAMADEAFHIGPAASSESYLRADKIIDVARRSNAEAVHPGYGFLSENADFAEICTEYGVKFIGPKPEHIRQMGDKITAKDTMIKANVPVVPGDGELLKSVEDGLKQAAVMGYPVMIKASEGGGGKGIRKAVNRETFPVLFRQVRAVFYIVFPLIRWDLREKVMR